MRLGILLTLVFSPLVAFAENQSFDVKVDGMTCAPCVKAVTRALEKIENVDKKSIQVSLKEKNAKLAVADVKPETVEEIKKAIESAGYKVTAVEKAPAAGTKKN